MKKVFEEPILNRIELNFNENIAGSSSITYDGVVAIYFSTVQEVVNCTRVITEAVDNPGLMDAQRAIAWYEENKGKIVGCSHLAVAQPTSASPEAVVGDQMSLQSSIAPVNVPEYAIYELGV